MRIRTYEYKRYEKYTKDIHDTRTEKVVYESQNCKDHDKHEPYNVL
jgi:hypothetical protein